MVEDIAINLQHLLIGSSRCYSICRVLLVPKLPNRYVPISSSLVKVNFRLDCQYSFLDW